MGYRVDQKIVIVTRPTQMGELRKKFNTPAQAKFQMVSAAKRELSRQPAAPSSAKINELAEMKFRSVESASEQYDQSVQQLRRDLDFGDFDLPIQAIDREFLPNFVFGPADIIVTVGQDGLVANTAKYAIGLPIVAVNPDPLRIDGVLLPFSTGQARDAVQRVLQKKAKYREVTLAEATLADGQKLLAFNELFIGARSHVSARYQLSVAGKTEPQSSSGLLVSTGAGSTGWLSSVFNMAAGVISALGKSPPVSSIKLGWEDSRLFYVVREPFASKSSRADLVAGILDAGQEITVESDMAANGVIFSDGIESDFLEFNAGAIARVRTAAGKALLVVA